MSKMTIIEVCKDKKGLHYFKLISKTGATVFTSEKNERKAVVMSTVKRLSDMVSKAKIVDADKKADAASKTTGKQVPKAQAKKAVKTAKKVGKVAKEATA